MTLLEPLNCYTVCGFSTPCRYGIKKWACLPSFVSYFCGKGAQDIPGFIHGSMGHQCLVHCHFSLFFDHSLRTGQVMTVTEPKRVLNYMKDKLALHKSLEHLGYSREKVAVGDQIKVALNRLSLASCKAILEGTTSIEKKRSRLYIALLILNHYPWYQLGISRLLKECTVIFLDSTMDVTYKGFWQRSTKAVQSMKTAA